MSVLIKGVTAHTDLTDKEVGGVIDHADDSVSDAKIASGVGVSDGELLKLPVATEDKILRRGATEWGLGDALEGLTVRENSDTTIGTRGTMNIIEGAGMNMSIADDPTDEEIDVTVTSKYAHWTKVLKPEDAALPTVNPAAFGTVNGTNFAYNVLDYDPATEESSYWEEHVTPDYLQEHLTIEIWWISAGAGNAKFGVQVAGREDGETWDAALGSEYYIVHTNAGAGKLNKATILTMPPAWSPDDVVLIKLARKAADAEDTINANDVRVLKVILKFNMGFGQSFYNLPTYVDVVPAVSASWQDVDCSPYIPEGATGVILHAINTSAAAGMAFGLRKKGSTDNRTHDLYPDSHQWAAIGVDSNRKFQCYFQQVINGELWLVGYTADGVTFFTNAYDKSPPATSSWALISCQTECPNAIGLIVEIQQEPGDGWNVGIRKNTSSDNRKWTLRDHGWTIIGCDGNQRIRGWSNQADNKFFIVGYVTRGAVFHTNAPDKSIGAAGAYTTVDCSSEAPNAVMLFFQIWDATGGPAAYHLRRKGSTEDKYYDVLGQYWGFIECDANQRVEMKVEDLDVDLYLQGYATSVA